MTAMRAIWFAALGVACMETHTARAAGNAEHGKDLYALCQACHSLDENDVGPLHRGLVGRRAGSVPGYAYSPALAAARFVWTAEQLDLWLQSPQKLVPGTKMFFSLADAGARQDVIAYLQTLSAGGGVATLQE